VAQNTLVEAHPGKTRNELAKW